MHHLLLALVLSAAAIGAQGPRHLSYPHDATTGTSGNNIAFGVSVGSSLDEGRYQLLIPARYLPSTGAVFVGLEVVPVGLTSHSLTLQSLQVTLSHAVRASLDATAANNLPNPMVVLAAQNLTLSYTRRQWSPIAFATPFLYDGQSDLVIDVQKVFDRNANPVPPGGSSLQTTGNPGRADLPRARWEFGGLGSGAAQAATTRFSGEPLFVRLQVASVPALVLRGDADGSGGNFFALGRSFDVDLQAPANAVYGLFAGTSFAAAPLLIPALAGRLQVDLPVTVAVGVVGAGGLVRATLPLPPNPAFAGVRLAWQGATAGPGAGTTPLWSCASDLLVNP